MKRLLHITALSRLAAIVTLLMMTIQTWAMTYEQAREQALFLTDKMAYELNLSQEQYEAAYEINLDYLMSVTTVDEVYSNYWYQRNIDMEYIMLDWQYSTFCATNYFYRPLYWDAGFWHFGIYAYYPHRDVFYFERPAVYVSYRGGHGWRAGGGRSWYATRTTYYRGTHRAQHIGLRDGYDRRNGVSRNTMSRTSSNINRQNLSSSTRNGYRSSTRTTVGNSNSNINNSGTYRNSRSSRSDNDDMYSSGRSSYRGSEGSNTSSYSGSGSNYNRHSYGSSSSSRQGYGSGSSNINRQSYSGSSSSRQSYSGSSSSRQSYSGSSSSSRQSYSGGSSNIGQMRGSSYGGSRSSSSSYGGSRSNISSFGGSSSGSMGSRSSGSMGSRSSGSMGGGSSRGSMGRR